MNAVDRTFGWLLVVASLLGGIGAIGTYRDIPVMLVWGLAATLAGLLLASLNLLRVGRPGDRMLAWISFCGCLAWLALVIAFAAANGNVLNFGAVFLGAIALVLAVFSFRSARGIHSAP